MKFVLSSLACCTIVGCADDKKASTMRQRQQSALNDPFSVNADTSRIDISGGDVGHYDKAGMKKDVHDFLDP
jgi:hypothetical protein